MKQAKMMFLFLLIIVFFIVFKPRGEEEEEGFTSVIRPYIRGARNTMSGLSGRVHSLWRRTIGKKSLNS